MIVREGARRGQLTYGRTTTEEPPARMRLAGQRSATTDDKGRAVMPFDLFLGELAAVDRPTRLFGSRVMELAGAFGF